MSRRPIENGSIEEPAQTYSVPALEKGLDVLELLSNARQALGLNEIAQALERSRQELFRVMVCLQNRGYLLRDDAGRYRLGSKMLEVGSRHVARQAMVFVAMPSMEDLAVATGESCQLSIVERNRLLVIATAVGSAHLQLEIKVGSSIPLFQSVVGLIAMAFAPEELRQENWKRRREMIEQGEDVIEPKLREYPAWEKRLETIRRDGYLVAPSIRHPGSLVHAAPLLNASGNLIAVLSLARLVPARERPQRGGEIVSALTSCARSISNGFGAAEHAGCQDD